MNEEREKLNRVYGRGFIDGMKAAGKEPVNQLVKEKVMNQAKFDSIYRGVSEQAKRVYQAVPISEHWSSAQVIAELSRTGKGCEQRIVLGCLSSLKDSGLVKEPAVGHWVRTEVRTKQLHAITPMKTIRAFTPPKEEETTVANNVQPIAQPKSEITALERISGLSAQLTPIIQNLQKLATDIEATAIEIEEQIDKVHKDYAKLKQFQELLKALS